MRTEDMILVSVDDHVIEPRGMFDGLLPKKYQDKAPKLVRRDDGTDVWQYDGNVIPNVGLNAVVGRPPEEYGIEPTSLDDMRVGCYDVHERVRDMSVNGVLGSMCFPSFPQFCGQLFARREDKDEARAMVQAYNDWHIDRWCGAEPGRFIPLSIPVIWDPELGAEEIHRVAKKGCHAVTFSENPEKLGWPSLHNEHWDPFWAACADEGTVVCMHLGSSSQILMTSVEAPIDVMISLQPINMVQAAADLVWSPILRKYKDLKFALVGGRHRLDPLRPGAHRLRLRAPPQVDRPGLRRPAAEPGLQGPCHHLLHRRRLRRQEPRLHEHRQHHLGVRLPALGLDVAAVARGAHEVSRRRVGRGDRQDDAPQRHEALPVRPVQRAAAREVHRGSAAGRGGRRRHRPGLARTRTDVGEREGHRERSAASRPASSTTTPDD